MYTGILDERGNKLYSEYVKVQKDVSPKSHYNIIRALTIQYHIFEYFAVCICAILSASLRINTKVVQITHTHYHRWLFVITLTFMCTPNTIL